MPTCTIQTGGPWTRLIGWACQLARSQQIGHRRILRGHDPRQRLVYPYVELEQREYRLRMLNACNARFLNPRIVKAKSNDLLDAKPRPTAQNP